MDSHGSINIIEHMGASCPKSSCLTSYGIFAIKYYDLFTWIYKLVSRESTSYKLAKLQGMKVSLNPYDSQKVHSLESIAHLFLRMQ